MTMMAPPGMMEHPTRYNLVIEHGDSAYNTPAKVVAKIKESDPASPSEVKIWEMTVPPGEKWRWGDGHPQLPVTMQRLIFVAVDKSATGADRFVEGRLQFRVQDPTGYRIQPLDGFSTQALRAAGIGVANNPAQADIDYDRQSGIMLAEMGPRVGWSNKLQIFFTRQTGDTSPAVAAIDDVYFDVPATRYV